MSTTVSYKGNTIATVDNDTATLTTAGKYLEADIILTDTSSGGSGFPATLIKTLTVPEAVNAFQFEWDSALDAYDFVYAKLDFELTASDWLYYKIGNDSETYGLSHDHHTFSIVISKQDTTGTSKRVFFPSNRVQTAPVGSVINIRTYVSTKYIKAGSTITFWGWNYADL